MTVQEISMMPSAMASFSSQPRSRNPCESSGDDVNFIEPLNSNIAAGSTLIIHPTQTIHFGFATG
jgi:hypothetical protein